MLNTHTHTHKVLNQVISHLEVTDKQLGRLGKATNKIELAYQGLTHHIRQTDKLLASLNRDIVLSQSINFLAFAAMNLQSEVAKVLNAIESQVETFRLSPVFLPPNEFLQILVTLQDHVKLLFPPTPKYLSSFYDVSKVIVRRTGDKFMFLVRIPLKSDELKFDLFKLTPLWHSAPNGSAWSRRVDIENDFLAVRKDSKYFTPLKDLGQCVGSRSLTVCTPKYGFASPHNPECLMALYKNHATVSSMCSFKYKDDYSPSFVKVGNSWISSSPRALQASEVCPTKSRRIKIPAGISQLAAHDSCQIVGDSFKLPSFVNSQQEVSIITIFPALDFPDLPTPTELKDTLKVLHLGKIDTFSHTQIALLASQSKITPHKLFPYRNTLIAILVTICVIGLCVVGRCIFSYARTCDLTSLVAKHGTFKISDKKTTGNVRTHEAHSSRTLNSPLLHPRPRSPTRPIPRPTTLQVPCNSPDYEDMVSMF